MPEKPKRQIPVRPNLDQLRRQAKELLRSIRRGDPEAVAELRQYHPETIEPAAATLMDAQLVLARSYGIPSWPRLVTACQMTHAIWEDDLETVRKLVRRDPELLVEDALGVKGNWGPPMSYAANVGQNDIIAMLREMGATDVEYAFARACLRGKLESARQLYAMGARPEPGIVMGPCETVNGDGLAFQLELGAELADGQGDRLAPLALILETYSRNPVGKHRCLEIVEEQGITLPDTPPMAVHRGRIDLLEQHLQRDPGLFSRTFSMDEIFPRSLGCHEDRALALHGTPLNGATLLHLCVDYDEIEIARWMLDRGAEVDAKAAVDGDGFGGHTALFGCVVSQSHLCGRQRDGIFAQLLLDHGADATVRASLRKELRFVDDETLHEYRDVTPLEWGEAFQEKRWVNRAAMRRIAGSIHQEDA